MKVRDVLNVLVLGTRVRIKNQLCDTFCYLNMPLHIADIEYQEILDFDVIMIDSVATGEYISTLVIYADIPIPKEVKKHERIYI